MQLSYFPVAGTLINVATVIAWGTLGTLLGNRLAEKTRETVLSGLGLMTLVIGLTMAIQTKNVLIPLFSVLIGGIIGESLDITGALERLGARAEDRFAPSSAAGAPSASAGTFAQGFVTASLLFCVGPMSILGSIQDGLMGDYNLLAVKSLMDGFAAMALASTLGAGVLLSALTVLGYQGGLSVLAMAFGVALGGVSADTSWVVELTATGGVVILSLAFILLDIKRIRAANLVPAIIVAPLLVLLLGWLGFSL
jgi:uncharacterized protein